MHTLIKKIHLEVCILVVKLGTLKEITPGGGGGGERGIGSSMASYIVNNNPKGQEKFHQSHLLKMMLRVCTTPIVMPW